MNDDTKNTSDQETIDGLTFDQVIGGDIFELVGLKLSDEERNRLATKMLSVIQIRVFDRVDSQLDAASREEFKKVLENGDSKAIGDFLVGKNIDYTALVAEEAAKYKIEFITYVKMIQKSGGTLADVMTKIKGE